VKENKQLSETHYLITLHPLKKITKPKPGQFFMLSVNNRLDPLLKRPFSFHRQRGQDFQLLYRTVGKATNVLKRKKPGDILEVVGPLGNGFPPVNKKMNPILIAGGLGVAPLVALAESIIQQSQIPLSFGTSQSRPSLSKVGTTRFRRECGDFKPIFFIGAKTKKELLCVNNLKSIGIMPIISTDDGTSGQKGLITDVLREFLTRHPSPVTRYCLYACGPKTMLKEISLTAKKYGIKGYMALEENMACGIGACLSCVVNTKDGFKRICKEGPVFPIEEIVW
ncbi:MAG: dihydroorotate dehydrogenase electron transfer subunit, partial [Nitrospirota bacterium]